MTTEEAKRMIDEIVKEAVKPLKEQQGPKFIEQLQKEGNKMETKEDKGLQVARIVRALAASKGDPERAAAYAKKNFGDDEIVKALSVGTLNAGGYIVPEEYSAEIIELLRPQSVVRRMGAVTIPMATGTLNIPKLAGGGSASYIGENTDIGVTQPTFGTVQLTWKKLAAIVPISNDLLRFSSPAADSIVRDDLVMAMALREDAAFIRDDGVGNVPKGLRYWAPVSNRIPATTGTPTLATVTTDLGKLILALKKANVRFIRPGWLMSPRTEMFLLTLRDGNGNFAFRPEMLAGRLFSYPYAVTTQIPENLGAGKNESEIYLVDFADAIIGESTQLIIDASTEASYYQDDALHSAFSLDQTLIRVIAEHDFAMRHEESVAVLTGVTWSA